MEINNSGNFGRTVVPELKEQHKGDGTPFGKHVSEAAHARNAERKTTETEQVTEIPEAPVDVQQDQAIIEQTIASDVTIGAGSEPLVLTYKAAIEKLNEILAPELGVERPLDSALEQGLDVSPEATAERIVSMTTAMYARYQEANPQLEGAELIDRFVDVIAGGIEQGFAEARDILDGLGVLGGDIAANIDTTFELVQQGLQAFREANGGTVATDSTETTASTVPADAPVEETIDPLLS